MNKLVAVRFCCVVCSEVAEIRQDPQTGKYSINHVEVLSGGSEVCSFPTVIDKEADDNHMVACPGEIWDRFKMDRLIIPEPAPCAMCGSRTEEHAQFCIALR